MPRVPPSDKQKREKRELIQSLKWIKAHSSVATDGSVQTTYAFRYLEVIEIIVHRTKEETTPEETHRRAVNFAIRDWFKENSDSDEDAMLSLFQRRLKTELDQLTNSTNSYTIVVFLNVDKSVKSIEPLHILGDQIMFSSWDDLSDMKMNEVWNQLAQTDRSNPILLMYKDHPIPMTRLFTPAIIKLKSNSSSHAVDIVEDRIDILRAALNINKVAKRFIWSSRPKQLSVFLPSPVYAVFDPHGNFIEPYLTIERYEYGSFSPEKPDISSVKQLLMHFSSPTERPATKHHILGLLRLYQRALDTMSGSSAFLAMWQVLESAVTFGQESVKMEEIAARVTALVGLDSLSRDYLDLLAETRNNLVHNGEFPRFSDNRQTGLRLFAELSIESLLNLQKEFPTTNHLADYMRYRNLSASDLDRNAQVIALIQKRREPSSE